MTNCLPSTEQKLLVLFCVDQLGPCTSLQLLQFFTAEKLMDYFEMQLGLVELCAVGQLQTREHPLGALYSVTPAGADALRLFSRRIRHSSRLAVTEGRETWRARFLREERVSASFETSPDGSCALRLCLLEGEGALMDLHLALPSTHEAEAFLRRWDGKAERIYGYVMKALGEDE